MMECRQAEMQDREVQQKKSKFAKGKIQRSRYEKSKSEKNRSKDMVFNMGAALLDTIVPAVVSGGTEGTYGYKITQDMRGAVEISELVLYPALRRLRKEERLEVYDPAIGGRNRRYYKTTEKGRVQLNLYKGEWAGYSEKISRIFKEADR